MRTKQLKKAIQRAGVIAESREQARRYEESRAEISEWYYEQRERFKRGELPRSLTPAEIEEIRLEMFGV